MQMLERTLNARIALAELVVLRLRSRGDDSAKSGKSGILDARKIYPIKLTDTLRRRPPSTLGSCSSVRSRRLCSPRLRAQYTFVVSSAGVLLKTCDHGESILYYHTTLGVRASRLHQ